MAAKRNAPWSREEVEATVADYLRMLRLHLAGMSYNKAEHHRDLAKRLSGRSADAVALKHQNISAILMEQRFVYIPGYKPMGHYQQLLRDVVLEQVDKDGEIDGLAMQAVEGRVVVPDLPSLSEVGPPTIVRKVATERAPEYFLKRPIKRDYLQIESQNRSLGFAGEKLIAEFEHRRLLQAGARKLADRVEHVADTKGDGLGYDVLSFDVSGRERFIEVKTTSLGAVTPFFVSRNELAFSMQAKDQFVLSRVHEFRTAPKFFEVRGPIKKNFLLTECSYIANLFTP